MALAVSRMGEGGTKFKVEHGKKPWFQKGWNIPRNKKFKALTLGLEHQMFRIGGMKEAAEFIDIKKAIGWQVGVTFKLCSNMAQMAIHNIKDPNILKPASLAPANCCKTRLLVPPLWKKPTRSCRIISQRDINTDTRCRSMWLTRSCLLQTSRAKTLLQLQKD